MKYFNPLLILLGIIFLFSAYQGLQSDGSGISVHVHNTPQWWQIYIPLEYDMITIPDYTILHLTIGTALTTAALTRFLQKTIKNQETTDP